MMNIWRLTVSTAPEAGVDPREFCQSRGLMGIGWAIECDKVPDWETYFEIGDATYRQKGDNGWWPAINALRNRVEIDDLCWTRDWRGAYYLGRVLGEWEYRNDPEYLRADVVNVRRCDWHRAGTVDEVPGKVVNSFRAGRTLQRVHDSHVRNYSQVLYNSLAGEDFYFSPAEMDDLLTFLLPDDVEDLVGIYLQSRGYRLIPSTCKATTMGYEYVLLNSNDGGRAIVQVKTGNVDLATQELADIADEVFLFTVGGTYIGEAPPNVVCLRKRQLLDFARTNQAALPPRIRRWIDELDWI